MGTTFEEIYEDWVLPIINDYKIDKLYTINKEVLFEYLRGFLQHGLTDFDSITPLTFHTEENETTTTDDEGNEITETTTEYIFDYDLSNEEKKIIAEITVAKYWKRLIQDVKARMPYMSQREFKKEATAPVMKQNDLWYNHLVSEYESDIFNYNLKNLDKLPYWSDLV